MGKRHSYLYASFLVAGFACHGAELQLLHEFKGAPTDGYRSYQFVVHGDEITGALGEGGSLYGGVLYRISTDGSGYGYLHEFASSSAYGPIALELSGGTLYGSTIDRKLYRLDEDGSNFQLLATTASSASDLNVFGADVYGITFSGGSTGLGTIFHVGISGSGYSVLHNFDVRAANPEGAPILFESELYGATEINGSQSYGTVYRLDDDGSDFTVLHDFGSGTDGRNPGGGLLLFDGHLYGTTKAGGLYGFGTIYRMNLDGSGYTVLHDFTGSAADLGTPIGTLQLADGWLYGAAGGISRLGSYFRLSIDSGQFQQFYSFCSQNWATSENFSVQGSDLYAVSPEIASHQYLFAIRNVPEPSATLFLASGALALAHRRRRCYRIQP